jgi:hypothetical protein
MANLPEQPSKEQMELVRKLLRQVDKNPKMRRAVAAAIKAMGLPDPPRAGYDSKTLQTTKPGQTG